jgi:hypothetical protein
MYNSGLIERLSLETVHRDGNYQIFLLNFKQAFHKLCGYHILPIQLKRYGAQLTVQAAKIRQQEVKLAEQATKLTDQDTQIAELKRHLEEWDHKFGDLTAELSRAREESGTIAEAGTSHEVEGRVARKILPVGSAETEGRVGRRMVRTATVVSVDVTDPGQGKDRDRNCKMKRKAESDACNVNVVKKMKVQSSNKMSE